MLLWENSRRKLGQSKTENRRTIALLPRIAKEMMALGCRGVESRGSKSMSERRKS